MPLPTVSSPHPLLVLLEPLTPTSFAAFGTVITSPLPPDTITQAHSHQTQTQQQKHTRNHKQQRQESVPSSIPPPLHPTQPPPIYANQRTALKTSPISPLINAYPPHPTSKPLMSLFTCFPRPWDTLVSDTSSSVADRNPPSTSKFSLPVTILERHPYTTQTFSPLGLSPSDRGTCFIVIVAPSLIIPPSPRTPTTPISNPPDLTHLRAFLAAGNQGITYGVGTWHAPMIVLGTYRVDLLVTQFVNGTSEDDCEEVNVENVRVALDLWAMGIHGHAGERSDEVQTVQGLWDGRRGGGRGKGTAKL